MLHIALDVSLRSAAAAAAVGLLLAALRVRSGAARHAAWSAVLVTMLTMPVLREVVPRVEVPMPTTVGSFEPIPREVSLDQRQDGATTQDPARPPASVSVAGL